MAAKEKKVRRSVRRDFDYKSIEPFTGPVHVTIDDSNDPDGKLRAYLAVASARDAFVRNDDSAPATAAQQAVAAIATARGRDYALWDYDLTGGAKALPGVSRIAYAPLDAKLAPERQAVKDAAVFGQSILGPEFAALSAKSDIPEI